ncbi:MAG: hypothetical protein HY001_01755 [Candidatus Portnoybacteria bacterium]|nr:hypothetical protein [Candidatus Portnoybacteria bacterium]
MGVDTRLVWGQAPVEDELDNGYNGELVAGRLFEIMPVKKFSLRVIDR